MKSLEDMPSSYAGTFYQEDMPGIIAWLNGSEHEDAFYNAPALSMPADTFKMETVGEAR